MVLALGYAKKSVKKHVDKSNCPLYKRAKFWVGWAAFFIGGIMTALSYYVIMRIVLYCCCPK